MNYFTPYEGKNPYVFVSYAHRNSDRVLQTASRLHEERYRVWYDEGIPAGKDWPRSVQDHLHRCSAVLFFLSEYSLASDNCFSEISAAAAQDIPVFIIRLDGSVPKDRWTDALAGAEHIDDQTAEEHLGERFHYLPKEKVTDGGGGRKLNGWILVAVLSALLLIAALTFAWGLKNGWFPGLAPQKTPEQAAAVPAAPQQTVDPGQWESRFGNLIYLEFPDDEQEDAVRIMLEKAGEEIPKDEKIRKEEAEIIKELYFCGALPLDSDENISWADGKFKVRGSTPAEGKISDFSFIANFLNLEKLVLINQNADSIRSLSGLPHLKELNVSGCRLKTLNGAEGFPALEVLRIEHTEIKDLTPLSAIPNLKTVTVSADMLPLELDAGAFYEVILVN